MDEPVSTDTSKSLSRSLPGQANTPHKQYTHSPVSIL